MSIDFQAPVESAYVNARVMSRTSDTSTTGKVDFLNATQSNDINTGSVIIHGGAAVKKNLNVGQDLGVAGDITSTGNLSAAVINATSAVFTGTLQVDGSITTPFLSATTANTTTTNATTVNTSNLSSTLSLLAAGKFSLTPIEEATLTGADAYLSGYVDKNSVYLTNVGLTSIETVEASTSGAMLLVTNRTGAAIVIKHLSGAITANQINTGSGSDMDLDSGASVILHYEATSAKWYALGGAGGVKKDLSNLTSPTAINQDLLPATDVTYDLGSNAKRWYYMRSQNMEFRYTDLVSNDGVNYFGQIAADMSTNDGIADVSIDAYEAGGTNPVGLHFSSSKSMIIRTYGITDSPDMTIKTGNASAGNSGNINLTTGTATGVRGDINLSASNINITSAGASSQFNIANDKTYVLGDATGKLFLGSDIATYITYYNSASSRPLRFQNASDNYIGLKAPASIAVDLDFTLPNADGTSGQVLSTDGAGNLSWITAGGGGGANQSLSNLTSPTAINQDLIFNTAALAFLKTKDDSLATTQAMTITTGDESGAAFTSGAMLLKTGSSIGTTASGGLTINTGANTNAANGNSGTITLQSGPTSGSSATSSTTGSLLLRTGAPVGAGTSGPITMESGANNSTMPSGSITIRSGINSGTGSSGGVTITTGSKSVGGSSGNTSIATGATTTSNSGIISIISGSPSGNAQSGGITARSGSATSGTSGTVNFRSGDGATTGSAQYGTGNATGTGGSGTVTINSGQATGSGASGSWTGGSGQTLTSHSGAVTLTSGVALGGNSGAVNLLSGGLDTQTTGTTGAIVVKSGDAFYTNVSTGNVSITTGIINQPAASGITGGVYISTGDQTGVGSSGLIELRTGVSSAGTRGSIVMDARTVNMTSVTHGLVIPKLAATPATPTSGTIYYDTTLNQLGRYNGATWAYL